jgi:hypothetical protein
MRSLQIGGEARTCKHHQRNGLIAQGARDWRDGAVEEITVEDRAVRMFVDQGESSDVCLSRTKSDPAIIADHLDEFCSDPIVVLGDAWLSSREWQAMKLLGYAKAPPGGAGRGIGGTASVVVLARTGPDQGVAFAVLVIE